MEKEKIIDELRFGIKVTNKTLTDGSNVYNVRIPFNEFDTNNLMDVYIEADSYNHAAKIAELIESGGMVDIKNPL